MASTITTLQDLAERVAPDPWADRQMAVAVRNRKLDPPPEWRFSVAADVEAYIASEMARVMWYYGVDNLTAVANSPLRITTGYALVALKKKTPDWPKKIAEIRKRYCDKYERKNREIVSGNAFDAVMRGHLHTLNEEIDKAVRKAITAPRVVVRATPNGDAAARRKLDWAELRAAVIDIKANTLTIGTTVFSAVEVELPGRDKPRPKKHNDDELLKNVEKELKGGAALYAAVSKHAGRKADTAQKVDTVYRRVKRTRKKLAG